MAEPLRPGDMPDSGSEMSNLKRKKGSARKIRDAAGNSLIDIMDTKLRRFRHGLWLALVILTCTVVFTAGMTYYYEHQCPTSVILASALDLADDDQSSNRVPLQLLQLAQTTGVSIVSTKALVNFEPANNAEAAVAVLDSSFAFGLEETSAGDFNRTYNDGNPLRTRISYSLPVVCVQPGISYTGQDVSSQEKCAENFTSSSSVDDDAAAVAYQYLFDLRSGCYLASCSTSSVINVISVKYTQCMPFSQSFSLATAYVAYVDMVVTSLVIIVYMLVTGECRNDRKQSIRVLRNFVLQPDDGGPDAGDDNGKGSGVERSKGATASVSGSGRDGEDSETRQNGIQDVV